MDPTKTLLLRSLGIIEREIGYLEKDSTDNPLPEERAKCLCAYTRVLVQCTGRDLEGADDFASMTTEALQQLVQETKAQLNAACTN